MNGAAKLGLIRARLAKILASEGTLSPDAVLKDAKSPKSPLHGEFEWDDSVAGQKYRIEQARDLSWLGQERREKVRGSGSSSDGSGPFVV